MLHLTLGSLSLALGDLLTKRLPALQSFTDQKSIHFLTLRRDRIAALPPELRGAPLAAELSAADRRHDGFGAVLWFTTEAALRHPDATPAMLDAAKKIRAAFIPSLDVLQARYDVEARSAKENELRLAALSAELQMFPLPAGGTLLDAAAAFVEEGKKLDALLSVRAGAKDRKQASLLRTEVLSKLTRLRADLADAKKDDPTLPDDLEQRVFGYVDMLAGKDAEAARTKAMKKAGAASTSPEAAGPAEAAEPDPPPA